MIVVGANLSMVGSFCAYEWSKTLQPLFSSYIPALKCLSEALVEEAMVFLTEFLNGKAVDNCERAVRVLAQVIELSGWVILMWHHVANASL